VATVAVAGGKVREFQATIDPQRLAAHGVSAQQVVDAVKNSNIIASPGLIEENPQLELALVSGQAVTPDQLNSIVVATVAGAPVRLADVASVGQGFEPQYTIVTADGRPAVLLNVSRQPDANTVTVVDEVTAELKDVRAQLPKAVRVATFYDQSLLVREGVRSVRDAIVIGLLLSVVILYVFLRNWGTTVVAILGDLIGDLVSSPEPIEVKLFSEDARALDAKAEEVEEAIKKVQGVVDTKSGGGVSSPALTFKADPELAARFGVTAKDIADTVTTAMSGDASSSILQQGRLINVRVIFPAEVRTSLDALRALQVRSASGALFRLEQVAEITYDKGQTEIDRDGLRQFVAVTGRLSGTDLGTAVSQIKARLARDVKLPPGMTVEYGGLYQEQQASFRELALALFRHRGRHGRARRPPRIRRLGRARPRLRQPRRQEHDRRVRLEEARRSAGALAHRAGRGAFGTRH
jgi:Cu/Ag efflux pump CusA